MKLAIAAVTAAVTASLCLGTPAEAKCGDSGTCNHGRIYVKPATAKTTHPTTTTRRHVATRTKTVKVARARTPRVAHVARTKRPATPKIARLHRTTTTQMALRVPVNGAVWHSASPSTRHAGSESQVVALITSMSPQYGVPTWFALRIAKIESGYNPRLRGKAGEYGVFQIKCNTARGLGFNGNCDQLADARTNVIWGLKHLSEAVKSSGGNLQLAASKHNGGLGRKTIIRHYVNLVF